MSDRDWRPGNPAFDDIEAEKVTDQQILGMQAEARALDYLAQEDVALQEALIEKMLNMGAKEVVIGSAKVVEESHHWYVTFGYAHRDPITNVALRSRYCIIEGTHEEVHDIAMNRFGIGWSMIYMHANDLPVELRIVNGRELPAFKWRGAGVQEHGLTYFDHRVAEPSIADRLEIDREKAGYYDPEEV
jgi:hypothetical protein